MTRFQLEPDPRVKAPRPPAATPPTPPHEPATRFVGLVGAAVRSFAKPPVLYLLGAALTAGLWLGRLNPEMGDLARAWPWRLFRSGGEAAFAWGPVTAFAFAMFAVLFAYALAVVLPPSRARGALALLATALAFASYVPPDANLLPYTATAVASILAGAAMADREGAGRRLLFASALVLGGLLAWPLPAASGDPAGAYDALAAMAWRDLTEGAPAAGAPTALLALLLAMAALLFVGVAGLVVRGGGVRGAAALLLYASVFVPLALLGQEGASGATWREGALAVLPWLAGQLAAFSLPLAGAVVDLRR
jgi:hypothetical protein